VLILDESANAKVGEHSAGSVRQHNGRLRKEDMCQAGVFLALANGHTCVERSIQDAKSELGWDEFQAQKLRAWEHQLALTVPASWLIAQTRLDSAQGFPPDPALQEALDVVVTVFVPYSPLRLSFNVPGR
jgi:SRSO17 transposase